MGLYPNVPYYPGDPESMVTDEARTRKRWGREIGNTTSTLSSTAACFCLSGSAPCHVHPYRPLSLLLPLVGAYLGHLPLTVPQANGGKRFSHFNVCWPDIEHWLPMPVRFH